MVEKGVKLLIIAIERSRQWTQYRHQKMRFAVNFLRPNYPLALYLEDKPVGPYLEPMGENLKVTVNFL